MKGQLDHEEKVVKVTVIVNRRTINANEEVILGTKKVPGSVVNYGGDSSQGTQARLQTA